MGFSLQIITQKKKHKIKAISAALENWVNMGWVLFSIQSRLSKPTLNDIWKGPAFVWVDFISSRFKSTRKAFSRAFGPSTAPFYFLVVLIIKSRLGSECGISQPILEENSFNLLSVNCDKSDKTIHIFF